MHSKLLGWDDTIVALATPPGVGALGMIRLSGKNAYAVMQMLFPSKDLAAQPTHTLHVGLLKDGATPIDEVVVSLFKSPHSYTGEDLIEISGHGSPYILQQIIDACIKQGARLAKAGEFTQRAYLNGKLDLVQAEAVADLIASNTSMQQRAAINNMRGEFSRQLKDLREQLIKFSALIELELDFSQEDVEFADRTQLYELIKDADTLTSSLIESFKLGNVIRNGINVAIVGKPNAGKSTLLNVLLNEERAIVSEIPGTTRDTIEEVINIDGILFRLIDTAGIREHTQDVIEKIGVQRSLEKMKQADLIIYLFDVNEMTATELSDLQKELSTQSVKYLLVGNKIDVEGTHGISGRGEGYDKTAVSKIIELKKKVDVSDSAETEKKAEPDDKSDLSNKPIAAAKFETIQQLLFISAAAKQNIDTLKKKMVDEVLAGAVQSESTVITNTRHFQVLEQLHTALLEVKAGLDNHLSGDLLALDIRRCLQYLGDITGEITNEDQLDYIFSKFCIGK